LALWLEALLTNLCSFAQEAYDYYETYNICFGVSDHISFILILEEIFFFCGIYLRGILVLHTITWHISSNILVCFLEFVILHSFILSSHIFPTCYKCASCYEVICFLDV
jgi:hypothetical protein